MRTDLNKSSSRYPGIVRFALLEPMTNAVWNKKSPPWWWILTIVTIVAIWIALGYWFVKIQHKAIRLQIEIQQEKTNGALPDQTSSSN